MALRHVCRSMNLRQPATFLRCLIAVLVASSGPILAESPIFSVQFGTRTIVFAGRIDSGEAGQNLAAAAINARPDLAISTEGLVIDPSTSLPNIADIKSLLEELGLSTHEGRFEIWPDRILVGGLTDSLVTLTALKIRLEPVLRGRRFVNHICIVSTEDLPKIDVSLSGSIPAPSSTINPGKKPIIEHPFESPGLLVEKILPTLLMLGDFDRIEGRTNTPSGPLRAMPVEMTETGPASSPPTPGVIPIATPVQQYETLPSIYFSTNSFLLQANQAPIFDDLAKHLLAPDRRGRLVILESMKPSGGSAAFNEYLSERRGEEVKRFLAERGVDAATLTAKVAESLSPVDKGEVRLRIEVPPLPAALPPPSSLEGAIAPPAKPAEKPPLQTTRPGN